MKCATKNIDNVEIILYRRLALTTACINIFLQAVVNANRLCKSISTGGSRTACRNDFYKWFSMRTACRNAAHIYSAPRPPENF